MEKIAKMRKKARGARCLTSFFELNWSFCLSRHVERIFLRILIFFVKNKLVDVDQQIFLYKMIPNYPSDSGLQNKMGAELKMGV